MQYKFRDVDYGMREPVDSLLPMLNRTIRAFRDAGRPVVFVVYDGPAHGYTGDPDFGDRIVEGVDRRDGDPMVHKRHISSFHDTDLKQVLDGLGVRHVYLSGVLAHVCVLSTYFAAVEEGFAPRMIREAIADRAPEFVDAVAVVTRAVSIADVESMLVQKRLRKRLHVHRIDTADVTVGPIYLPKRRMERSS